ncbi:MAG: DEAD/DEAH box helicase [Deltaproteobacteria bacterium]|nr:MAG: DEAD/DEAH box helicase [Deltaproteobacteria bacterium]
MACPGAGRTRCGPRDPAIGQASADRGTRSTHSPQDTARRPPHVRRIMGRLARRGNGDRTGRGPSRPRPTPEPEPMPPADPPQSTAAIDRFVESLQRGRRTAACVTAVHRIPARSAETAPWPADVPEPLRQALASRGIERPWSHQALAWDHLLAGRHTVIVTPTASGKTLCYNLPILRTLAGVADGSALYLYPTKALAQDQCAELNALLDACGLDDAAHVYDGDTPADIRRRVRETGRVILSNPDMLHASILPNHEKWRRMFRTLTHVVVDEMHTYRGVFGSHVANVLRRLRRLCRHYGSDPVFALTSATIANPGELGARLIEAPVEVVDRNGAPAGERVVVTFNPPLRNRELQLRQSPGAAAGRMARTLLEDGRSVIVFARSRQGVEILVRRLREGLSRGHGTKALARRVAGYRGGYLPEERRRIERGLREGSVQGVVTTNALELGIDIGSLDVCLIAGYPGTIASTWQQAGRAGRRQGKALVILIAGDDPVDQYLVQNPGFLLDASPEHGRIDADNLRILAEHLKCATFELGFAPGEGFGDVPAETVEEVLAFLADETGMVTRGPAGWTWSAEGYPAGTVSLRAIADENFVIIDTTAKKPEILGEIDFESAHVTVYPNAIYQHAGTLYEVHRLDYPERKAYVREVRIDYFTQAIDQDRVFVLDVFDEAGGAAPTGCGEVRIVTRFQGYKKIRFRTFENIGYGEIHLPDLEKHTTAWWVTFPEERLAACGLGPEAAHGALVGAGRLLQTVALVHLMCTSGDLELTWGTRVGDGWEPIAARRGRAAEPVDGGTVLESPTIFLYDRCPGGVGFSEKLFALGPRLLAEALALVDGCPCEDGCPACVGPADLVGAGGKEGAARLLRHVIGAGQGG